MARVRVDVGPGKSKARRHASGLPGLPGEAGRDPPGLEQLLGERIRDQPVALLGVVHVVQEVVERLRDDGFEVDFLAEHPRREPELIQVSAHVGDSKTRERELRALGPALSEGRKRRATLVTLHESGEVALDHGRKVRIVPAWRWLLEDLLDRLDAEHGPADEALVEKHTELLS